MKHLKRFNESHYDLVSQFTGDHQGNPAPKNEFLNSLDLDKNGIQTLENIINLISSDRNWISQAYPDGYSYKNIITDISRSVNNLKNFIENYQSVNPSKIANELKDKILRQK